MPVLKPRMPQTRTVPGFRLLGVDLPMATYGGLCRKYLPADKPWDVVSATPRSSGVAPRAYVRVYARVLVPLNRHYIHTYSQ